MTDCPPAKPPVREVLERAHDLLTEVKIYQTKSGRTASTRNRWTKGTESRVTTLSNGEEVIRYCVIGAVRHVARELGVSTQYADEAEYFEPLANQIPIEILPQRGFIYGFHDWRQIIAAYNDDPHRQFSDIEDLFTKTIKGLIELEEHGG